MEIWLCCLGQKRTLKKFSKDNSCRKAVDGAMGVTVTHDQEPAGQKASAAKMPSARLTSMNKRVKKERNRLLTKEIKHRPEAGSS